MSDGTFLKMSRKEFRNLSMKLIFQYDFYTKNEFAGQIDNYLKMQEMYSEEDRLKVKERAMDIFTHIKEIDEKVKSVLEGWSFDRLGRVEKAITRVAVYELMYDTEVPDSVAINEAVELSKEYSIDDVPPKFVNGLLSRVYKALKNE